MRVRSIDQPLFLAAALILASLYLSACATLPESSVPAAPATLTREPTFMLASPTLPTTRTPTPSPTAAFPLTETILPTEPPLAVSNPSLGYDCSQVERLPVDSPGAQRLAEALVASYKEKLPTEYIAIDELWAVERLGEYALLQLGVTDEAAGIFVLQQTPTGNEYVAGQVWGGWPFPSRHTLPEFFTAGLPDAPPELFYCMSLGRIFFDIQANEELDLGRQYDCSMVESVPPDSTSGQSISQALLDYWTGVIEVAPVALDQVYAIQQTGPYAAIQVRFLVDGRLEPPELFIAKHIPPGYEFVAQTGGGGPDRSYILRILHAQDTSIPPELLACLALDGWMLATPAPAP